MFSMILLLMLLMIRTMREAPRRVDHVDPPKCAIAVADDRSPLRLDS